jgi:prepilin-type N-terminal cleavage/methylation domain-containing protein
MDSSLVTHRRAVARGFTLVELLVVIAIIGTLVGLLLPAINAARESARRSQCGNNLRQIGLACQAHLEATGGFPNGGHSESGGPTGQGFARTLLNGAPAAFDKQVWAWGYQILPYSDNSALFNNLNDQVVAGTPVALYYCPTRRRPVALTGGKQTRPYPTGMTDYAGNAGVSNLGYADELGQAGDGITDGIVIRQGVSLQTNGTEILIPQTSTPGSTVISQANVTDGMSNTILVGEKRMNTAFCTTECQVDDNDGYVGGFQDDVVRYGSFPPEPDWQGVLIQPGTLTNGDYEFGSSHPTLVQFVFCDGAIHGISYRIDQTLFSNLSSRNDNQPVDVSKF